MNIHKIKIYKNILGEQEKWAEETKALLKKKSVRMFNLIGSPGCGKTALLESFSRNLKEKICFAVLEGDVETTRDAERLNALGINVSQLITSGACHLGAKMVYEALQDLPFAELDLVIVENVGNLVCPAEFDIGETAKVAVLSITEGEDKPLKYPLLFREAKAVVLTKLDLLPFLQYNLATCINNIKNINSEIPIFQVSVDEGKSVSPFINWLTSFGI